MHNKFSQNIEYNECTARGSCSLAPSVSAVQEVLLVIIKQTAFYLQKLNLLDIDIRTNATKLIQLFANNIISTAYNETEIIKMIKQSYNNLVIVREEYYKICQENKIAKIKLPNNLNIEETLTLAQIIALGEKFFQERYKKNSLEKRNYIEFLTLMIKNCAKNLTTLNEYTQLNIEIINILLTSINMLNRSNITFRQYKKTISKLAATNLIIFQYLYKHFIEKFGDIRKTAINYSTTSGKAILVSGSNLVDLYDLLEYTKDENIDIYTHDSLVIAHTFDKFKKFKNLKGQFGNCLENCILDFALFPGAIFITKNSNINTEYMYRGRIFTTSNIIPQGVIKIENKNYSELLDSAMSSRGFAKGQNRNQMELAFDEAFLEESFKNLIQKMNENLIKHIVIIDAEEQDNDYIKTLIKLIPDDIFILTLSYKKINKEYSLNINYGDNPTLLWRILEILNKHIPLASDKISYIFSKCDIQTISNIIYFKDKRVNNLYFAHCKPNTIKPTLIKFITQEYDIKEISTAENDYKTLFSID